MRARVTAIVAMGVSGSGKSTIGRALAAALGWPFVEGDDLHPPANIAKMRRGVPLDDDDRAPWLATVAGRIKAWRSAGGHGVIACSALKRAYRTVLAAGGEDVRFVYLKGDEDVLARRMAARTGHFMPPALLPSQLAALEPPTAAEGAVTVDIDQPAPDQLAAALHGLGLEGLRG